MRLHLGSRSLNLAEATAAGIKLDTGMSASSTTTTTHSPLGNRPAASAPLLSMVSESTLHSRTSSSSSEMGGEPVVLTSCSSQFDTNDTAPHINEHTINGTPLNLRNNEEANTVEGSYVTQLRSLARAVLEGAPADDLEVNLSRELLSFYEEDLKKRGCIVDEVYVGQITHLLERILRKGNPRPTRIDLFYLLLRNYKNQFETMVRLAGVMKRTLAMAEDLEETCAYREAPLYDRIEELQHQLAAVSKKENVLEAEDGLADEDRVREDSLSDKFVALNDSYTMLMERYNALEKENIFLKVKSGALEKRDQELETLEKKNKRLKHKAASLEKGENVKKLKQKIATLEKGNKEQKQKIEKLEQENRKLKPADDDDDDDDDLEEENKLVFLKQVNGYLEKENRELKHMNDALLENQSAIIENMKVR